MHRLGYVMANLARKQEFGIQSLVGWGLENLAAEVGHTKW